MSNNLTPTLKLTPILLAVVFSILFVSAATLWPMLQQYKSSSIQKLNNESTAQLNLITSLLEPVENGKTEWSRNKAQTEALKKIKTLWQKNTKELTDFRYFLVSRKNASAEPKVLLDIGATNIPLSQSLFKPIFDRSFTENTILNISEDYYLSLSPIYSDRFGLMILHKQPNITQIIEKIAPYTGLALLVSIVLSWLILKLSKRRALKKIGQSQTRYKQLVESSMDWIWETDQYGNLTFCSDQCFNILGYTPLEMVGKPIFNFLLPSQAKENEQKIMQFMQQKDDIYNLEISFESKIGSTVSVLMHGQMYRNEHGKIIGYRGINRDITKQKEKHETIMNMAFYDPLTELPNRPNLINKLNDHLDTIIKRRDMSLSALLFIDLDGFKDVNDSQGHEVGDMLLKTIADRMKELSGEPNQVFRLGGDEFVVLIRCKNQMLMPDFKLLLEEYLKRLLAAINTPMIVDHHNIMVTASVGIAMIPEDGRTSSEILSHADSAMYRAKHDGKNCFRYFDASMQELENQRKQMIIDIKHAIKHKEFQLYYQLQIDSQNQKIYGMEALIRWPSSRRGTMISPLEFIQLATESNNIQSIDEWVITQAAKDIAQMQQSTNRSIPVSINLSAKTLENPKLPELVSKAIEENFLAPADIRLEVTETSLLKNLDKAVLSLQILRNKGIETSIDDFGTGYSSLSYLQNLPIDTLKIDKSFIDKITTSNSDLKICRSIIQLAKSLDKNLIAEGVQYENQKDLLTNEGCFIIQGFLYSKPQPMSEIIQLLMKPDIKENSGSQLYKDPATPNTQTNKQTETKLRLINDI